MLEQRSVCDISGEEQIGSPHFITLEWHLKHPLKTTEAVTKFY